MAAPPPTPPRVCCALGPTWLISSSRHQLRDAQFSRVLIFKDLISLKFCSPQETAPPGNVCVSDCKEMEAPLASLDQRQPACDLGIYYCSLFVHHAQNTSAPFFPTPLPPSHAARWWMLHWASYRHGQLLSSNRCLLSEVHNQVNRALLIYVTLVFSH